MLSRGQTVEVLYALLLHWLTWLVLGETLLEDTVGYLSIMMTVIISSDGLFFSAWPSWWDFLVSNTILALSFFRPISPLFFVATLLFVLLAELFELRRERQNLCEVPAIHRAIDNGKWTTVKFLVASGANIERKDKYGRTPLHRAIYTGHEEVVEFLIEKGANPNAKNEWGNTPLHEAIDWGCVSVVKLLLEKGANSKITNNKGEIPLHQTSRKGHKAVVKLLLEHDTFEVLNAEDKNGDTPLHWASFNGKEDVVQLLLENGANPNITNDDGKTPLQVAQERNQQNCVQAIVSFQEEKHRLEQFKKECLTKFATRTQLDKELQKLQELMEKAKDCPSDKKLNKAAKNASEKYNSLLPLCNWPEYMEVSKLNELIEQKKDELREMEFGDERLAAVDELVELKQQLEQEERASSKKKHFFGMSSLFRKVTKKESSAGVLVTDPITRGRLVLVEALDSPVATKVQSVSWNYVDFLSNNFGDIIASGGFGTIYSGIDMDANAQVAIKVLRSDRLSARDKEEFEKEILCLSELRHPNVVRLLAKSISANDKRICMILEYAAGGSVASILASTSNRKLFTPSVRLYVAECLVSAIEYLHSKGIFHRDIKPENMCMHEGWEHQPHMVLVDFGIAMQIPNNVASATMTSNPGTEMFMAPEYADKTSPRFDEKSEVFSIGAVLTCLLTGGFSLVALGDATGCTTDILFEQRDEIAGSWHEDVARSLSDTTSRCNRVDASERPTVKKLLCELKDIRSQNGQLKRLSPESVRRIQTHRRLSQQSRLPESNRVRQCVRCGLDRSAGIICPRSHLICTESTCLEYMARSQKGSDTFRCLGVDCEHSFFLADFYGKINPDLYNELLLAQDKEVDASFLMNRISFLFESLRDDIGQGLAEVKQEVHASKDEILLTTTHLVTSVQLETEIPRESINQSVEEMKRFAEKLERREGHLEKKLKALRKQEMSGVGNQLTLEQRLEEISKQLVDLSLKNAKGVAALASGRLQCPRLFILWPMRGPRRAGVRRLVYKEYRLFFLCEHDKSLVKTSVTIKHVHPWLKKVAPFVKFALFLIRMAISVYGIPIPSLPGFIPGADASEQFKEAYEHMEMLLLDVDPEAMHSLRCWLEECSDCMDGEELHELIRKYEGEVSEEAYAALATIAYKPKNRGWMSEMDIACSGTNYGWVKKENVAAFEQGLRVENNRIL